MKNIEMVDMFHSAINRLTAEMKAWRENCTRIEFQINDSKPFCHRYVNVEVEFKRDPITSSELSVTMSGNDNQD